MKIFNLDLNLKNAILLGLWAECLEVTQTLIFGHLSDYIHVLAMS